jgi:serine/threonine-protein kinase HipA
MISALTLLQTEDTHQSRDKWSYILLVEELRRASAKPQDDAKELFRRMVFNALISNNDDHPRNHALLAKDADWRLSPAYDLTPAPLISIERRDLAMACGYYGRIASAQNLLSQAGRFLLDPEEAKNIMNKMVDTVRSNWHKTLLSVGASEQECAMLEGSFVYPGFLTGDDF